jgi:hypothetical protein
MLEEIKWGEYDHSPNCKTNKVITIITPCPYNTEKLGWIVGGVMCRKICKYNHNKDYTKACIVKCGFKSEEVNKDKEN